jgi:hypothetical protein
MTTVRLEHVRLVTRGAEQRLDTDVIAAVIGTQTLAPAGGVAALSDGAPAFPTELGLASNGHCAIRPLDGDVLAAWGDAPDAAAGPAIRIAKGAAKIVPLKTGQKVSLLAVSSIAAGAAGVDAVTGSFHNLGQSAAFAPLPGRPFNVTIDGGGSTLRLERQFGGAGAWYPVTDLQANPLAFSAPVSLSLTEHEAGVLYRLNCTAYAADTAYRLSQ